MAKKLTLKQLDARLSALEAKATAQDKPKCPKCGSVNTYETHCVFYCQGCADCPPDMMDAIESGRAHTFQCDDCGYCFTPGYKYEPKTEAKPELKLRVGGRARWGSSEVEIVAGPFADRGGTCWLVKAGLYLAIARHLTPIDDGEECGE